MAGGIGSRFWPESRTEKPKQFLDILNTGQSLLQLTYNRAKKIVKQSNILVVSNRRYKDLIVEQIPDLTDQNLLLEPSMRNTAPCVAYTALHLEAIQPDAVFAMLPSDHVIKDEVQFVKCMERAFYHAGNSNDIVTLGITPTRPDTGYGYIHFERKAPNQIYKVHSFKEKPDVDNAKAYIESGEYLWNAGMFIWSVNNVLKAFAAHAPEITEVLTSDKTQFGTVNEQRYIDEIYHETNNISVDYAILELAENVVTIPADIGWSDLGTWNSLYEYLDKTDNNNVVHTKRHHLTDVKDSLIRSSNPDKRIVVKGIKDFIIVDHQDTLLIYPRADEQEIKQIRSSLEDDKS